MTTTTPSSRPAPRLGAHMSTAGGLHTAFDRLSAVQGGALQIFSRSQRQWRAAPLADEAVRLWRAAWERAGRPPVAVHDSYLINLAAPSAEAAAKSVAAFADELGRAETLGVPYVVTHPGSHLGDGAEAGLARFVANLDRAIEASATSAPLVLLENTAGQGTNLGSDLAELAAIIEESRHPDRLGVCFDTCHAFAAGLDLRDAEGYAEIWRRFDALLGLDRLRFMHLNDSKKGLGSRVDRHEHVGRGAMGPEPFWRIMNDPRLAGVPMVLETPKEEDLEEDRVSLAFLRGLIGADRPPERPEGPIVAGRAAPASDRKGADGESREEKPRRPGRRAVRAKASVDDEPQG